MRQWKKVIQTQTEGKEESGYNEGRKAKKCDGDIGNNEVHHPNWMSCHVLVGNWAGGWLVEVIRVALSALPYPGLLCGQESWLSSCLSGETLLTVSDPSLGWWVINDSVGVASGLKVIDRVATSVHFPCACLCIFWTWVSWGLGKMERGESSELFSWNFELARWKFEMSISKVWFMESKENVLLCFLFSVVEKSFCTNLSIPGENEHI